MASVGLLSSFDPGVLAGVIHAARDHLPSSAATCAGSRAAEGEP